MALYIPHNTDYFHPKLEAKVVTGSTSFGEPGMYWLLEYIDIDYAGYGYIHIYLDGKEVSFLEIPSTQNRTTKRIYINLNERKPFTNIYFVITRLLRLYNLELELTPMQKY